MTEASVDVSHFPTRWARHTEERLREAVAASTSVKEVLGIDTSHFETSAQGPKRSRGDLLSLGTPQAGRIPGSRLLRHLLRIGVPQKCVTCGTGPWWNGKPLRLEVDHVNGDWWDNRPGNLQLLCPNCHAVTDTYRGRRRRVSS
nr:HNH endonuclease [Streptomyces luteogriseus]